MRVCDVQSIEKYCGANSGGISEVYLLLPSAVARIGVQHCVAKVAGNSIVLNIGHNYIKLAFAKQTAVHSEKTILNNKAGDYYEQNLSLTIPKQRHEVLTLVQQLRNRRFHAIYKDSNGMAWLLQNLRLSAERTTGARYVDRNGVTFSFTGRSLKPAPWLEGWTLEVDTTDELVLISPAGFRYKVTFNENDEAVTTLYPSGTDPNIVLIDELNGMSYRLRVQDDGILYTTPDTNGITTAVISGKNVYLSNELLKTH